VLRRALVTAPATSSHLDAMHDVLRQRLLRKIESLPDEQIYQVLDYIEFLESKYAAPASVGASGLQKFAEGLEDKLRRKAVSPSTIREAFQLISAADRVLAGVSSAGRQILSDLNQVLEPSEPPEDGPQVIEADPRKSGSKPGRTGAARPAAKTGRTEAARPAARQVGGDAARAAAGSAPNEESAGGAVPEPEGGLPEDA
jgi:hypothetical protein